jgi:hypothetical protein
MKEGNQMEENKEMLQGCGRKIAEGMLRSAVEEADDADQMNNQVEVLHFAAVHILAAEMYNQSRQLKNPPDDFIMRLSAELRAELKFYSDQDLELSEKSD